MANMPFELTGRRVMDGALCLVFKCAECGDKVSLVIRDTDVLKDRYPVACTCGAEVNMFFGSPRVARNMLRALRREAEAEAEMTPHRCHSPLLN
jgi:DNA-directed RNA polymerase subunit RPC12/RpoP